MSLEAKNNIADRRPVSSNGFVTMNKVRRYALLLIAEMCGCRSETPSMAQPTFQFTVEEVFYIEPPVDRIILVGTVQEGTVNPGDAATVECKAGPVSVVVESIEAFKKGEIKQANKGDQVGLKLRGITRNQAWKGDQVVGMDGG